MSWCIDQAEAHLSPFLAEGAPPVVIPFGSMRIPGSHANLARSILQGLRSAYVESVIFLPGEAGLRFHYLDSKDQDAELLAWAQSNLF